MIRKLLFKKKVNQKYFLRKSKSKKLINIIINITLIVEYK